MGNQIDQHPLRQEDYLAMAEENRRLSEQVHKLTNKKKRKVNDRPVAIVIVCLFVVLSGLLYFTVKIMKGCNRHTNQTTKRTTTCYFTRIGKTIGEKDEPWEYMEGWAIYKSSCSSGQCLSNEIATAPSKDRYFRSQQEAWEFIQKWNLVPCK